MMKKLGAVLVLVLLVHFGCAAHYISGWTEDALDGEGSDGKSVVMWNPVVGIDDNLTDVVGITGNSEVSGVYMLDCEMLDAGCIVGEILSLKIFGERYVSWIVNVTISGLGYDVPENLSLNSPPSVDLVFPEESEYVMGSVDFNCSFFDYDDNIAEVSLWGNWSGDWIKEANVTSGLENGYIIFNEDIVQGNYKWNCFVEDDLEIGSFNPVNNSFFVDTTLPMVSNVGGESLEVCGFGNVAINCSAYDLDSEVDSVIIQSISPENDLVNYSANLISGDVYGADVLMNSIGDWGLICFANDSAGNVNSSSGDLLDVYSGNAELGIVGNSVKFDVNPSVEGEIVNISVNVSNSGCVDSGNFAVGFYDGVLSFENKTVSVGAGNFLNVSVLWATKIGLSEIFVYVDLDEEISEDNESNNVANNSIYLKAWQGIYGNLSLDKILGGGIMNISLWVGEESFVGNIFVADSESDVDWNNLQAIGRTKSGEVSSGDFGEIDYLLGMDSYNDSIDELFGVSGLDNFSVFQREIENVAYVNSSVNGNFVTGILWDMSDSGNAEYDSGEGEDIVFVAKVNRGKIGSYGICDYEILVPSKLRGYDSGDEEKVYLYYDLN